MYKKTIYLLTPLLLLINATTFAKAGGKVVQTDGSAQTGKKISSDHPTSRGGSAQKFRRDVTPKKTAYITERQDETNHEFWNAWAADAVKSGVVWTLNGTAVGAPWELDQPGWFVCKHPVYQWIWCGPYHWWFTPEQGYFFYNQAEE